MILIRQIFGYIYFVAVNFRSFYLLLALTLVALAMEYLAASLMIPLSRDHFDGTSFVVSMWSSIVAYFDMQANSKTWLWLFFVIMTARLIFGYLLAIATVWLGKRVHESLSQRVFSHVISSEPMAKIYERTVGYYVTMAGDDTFKGGTIVTSFLNIVAGLSTALVSLIVLAQFSISIFWGIIIFLFVCCILIALCIKKILLINTQAVNLSRELGTTFIEAINSLRSIRTLHVDKYVLKTYLSQVRNYLHNLIVIDAIKTGTKTFPGMILLLVAVTTLTPNSNISMLSGIALFGVTVIIIRLFTSLGQMIAAGAQLITDINSIKDIDSLVKLASQENLVSQASLLVNVQSIDLSNLSYSYSGGAIIFNDINYRFEVGRTYAIVGPSGSGKSTLADILLGLSQPTMGNIVVNEGAVSLKDVAGKFMLVEQQPKIFSTTLRENLLLGMSVDDQCLVDVIKIVCLDEMIGELTCGLNTRANYLGENFSGGQRQRLGIARALIRKPDVLILDEATSALDSFTRAKVVDNLREYMINGIIIFITHDVAVASIADSVLNLDDFKVA